MTSAQSNCQRQAVMKKEIEGAFWVNILSGGVWGSTTDYATDKMWTYDDSVVIICQ